MDQKRQPYLSVGIDIGADFSLMAVALPTQEIIGRPYKILHSSYRSVQGAVDRVLSLGQTYELPVRVYMESTGVYHLPLYHRFKDAGLEVFVLNPIVTHANQNTNIRNVHNDKYDAQRIALLGLRPGLKTVRLGMAQADSKAGLGVHVNQQNFLSGLGQSHAEIDTTCRFSHTALLIDKGDDLGVHGFSTSYIGFPHREVGMKKGRM